MQQFDGSTRCFGSFMCVRRLPAIFLHISSADCVLNDPCQLTIERVRVEHAPVHLNCHYDTASVDTCGPRGGAGAADWNVGHARCA
jgi:hypothetical protein